MIGVIGCAGNCAGGSAGAGGGRNGKGGAGGGGGGGGGGGKTANGVDDSETDGIGGGGDGDFFGDFVRVSSNACCNLCSSCIKVSLPLANFLMMSCMPLTSAVKAPMTLTLLARTYDKKIC